MTSRRVSMASEFLDTLFSGYPADVGLYIELRPIPVPSRWEGRWRCLPLTADSRNELIASALSVSESSDVYLGALPRSGQDGTAPGVRLARFLWADIDGGDGGPKGARFLLENAEQRGLPWPCMIVKSGGGLHCYWELPETVEMADAESRRDFSEILKRLVRFIGGESPAPHADPASTDPPRILRLPGTWNRKQETPRPVKLAETDVFAPTCCLEWWKAFLPALPLPAHAVRSALRSAGEPTSPPAPERLLAWASRGYPEGNRHRDLVSAGAWLVRDVKLDKGVALDLLRRKADASPGRRSIPDSELEKVIQWA